MANSVKNSSTRSELPDRVRATITCDGRPIPGLFVSVRIAASRKNDFSSAFGPTDATGTIAVTRSELLREAERDRQFFIMDYGHPELDYAGVIYVTPMNREALGRAVQAYHQFQAHTQYPPLYAERLQEARRTLEGLAPAVLHLDLTVEGGTGEVVPKEAQA
jgi:hypothetical protein